MSTDTNPQPLPHLPDPALIRLESRILRALCCASDSVAAAHLTAPSPSNPSPRTNNPTARTTILASLSTHHWQDPEHRVLFEALTRLPARSATELREHLPAQATRMGFPEVNWDAYFAPSTDNAAIETLVAELLNASREDKP